jgi:hypothetical protein
MSEHRKSPADHGATNFSIVLVLSGLSQAWFVADGLWSSSRIVGVAMLALTVATWLWLLAGYGIRALRGPNRVIFAGVNLLDRYLLVRTAVDLIRRAIEAIGGGSAEPVPVLVPIPIGATGRRQKKLRSS